MNLDANYCSAYYIVRASIMGLDGYIDNNTSMLFLGYSISWLWSEWPLYPRQMIPRPEPEPENIVTDLVYKAYKPSTF